jgi:hypothetical protein
MARTKKKVQRKARPIENAATRVTEDTRPLTRVPMHGGYRDILTVANKDPRFRYRWILDVAENGGRIFRAKQAGYEMAPAEGLAIGQNAVYHSTESKFSIVRQPATKTTGEWFYLMRIPIEYAKEDDAAKQAQQDLVMKRTKEPDPTEEQYGRVKESWEREGLITQGS